MQIAGAIHDVSAINGTESNINFWPATWQFRQAGPFAKESTYEFKIRFTVIYRKKLFTR